MPMIVRKERLTHSMMVRINGNAYNRHPIDSCFMYIQETTVRNYQLK